MDSVRVVVQPGTGYELLLSALTVADRGSRGRLDEAATWARRIEAIDGGRVARGFERFGREPFINLVGLAHALTDDPSAENVCRAFAEAEPRELVLTLVGYHRRAMRLVTTPSTIRAAVDGDRDAQREFRRSSFPELRHWQASLRYLLGTPHAVIKDELVGLLTTWLEGGFGAYAAEISLAQANDTGAVRELLAELELDAVLERIAPGISFAREVGQALVVLVPDLIIRPGYVITDHGPILLIAYPAGTDAGDPAVPPERLVRLAKALSDPIRLRAMRELRDGPSSITELANRLGVPRTSLQHHVGILIYAGLVSLSVDDARWGQLELRDEALADVTRLAERFVLGRER